MPSARMKCAPSAFGGPEHHRIPQFSLARDQRFRMRGAVKQQIRAEIFCEILGDGVDPVDHRLADGVGESGQRHRQGIDDLALRIPFRDDAVGDIAGRRHQRPPGGRPHLLAVELNSKAVSRLGDVSLLVETLALWPARGAPDRFLRIERRLPGHFVE